MMRLQSGDVVKILDDSTKVRVLLGTGALKSISRASSPYTVAGKVEGGSFLSNLMGEVKKMLVASSDRMEAVAMMTRGRASQLVVLAVGAEENLVLAGSRQLLVAWRGGKAPYKLSLIKADDEAPLLSTNDISQQQLAIDTGNLSKNGLTAGEYQVLVEEAAGKIPSSQEVDLLVVEREELSQDAQKLLGLGLDKRVEARFLINLLHKQPEWRFFAYGLAVRHGLEKERRMLLQMK
jgi:hypothetical protein